MEVDPGKHPPHARFVRPTGTIAYLKILTCSANLEDGSPTYIEPQIRRFLLHIQAWSHMPNPRKCKEGMPARRATCDLTAAYGFNLS